MNKAQRRDRLVVGRPARSPGREMMMWIAGTGIVVRSKGFNG